LKIEIKKKMTISRLKGKMRNWEEEEGTSRLKSEKMKWDEAGGMSWLKSEKMKWDEMRWGRRNVMIEKWNDKMRRGITRRTNDMRNWEEE
jgi:hypothetical protein